MRFHYAQQPHVICSTVMKESLTGCDSLCHAAADTFLDAEESEEEDADKSAYDYKDLAEAFDQGGFDGLSQSDTSDAESMSEGDDEVDDEAAGTGPFKSATKGKQQKQKGRDSCSASTTQSKMRLLSCFTLRCYC